MQHFPAFLIFACLAILLNIGTGQAQTDTDLKLATQYYNKGEYEKAAAIFEKLYKSDDRNTGYYRQYFKTLMAMKDFETAETLIGKQLKNNKKDITLFVDLGSLYKYQDMDGKAATEFDKAANAATEAYQVRQLARAFMEIDEVERAIAVYKKGAQMQNDNHTYAFELGQAYSKIGDFENMAAAYLDYAEGNPSGVQTVKNYLNKFITKDEDKMEELQAQLYARIREKPSELIYPELLVWSLVQQKDFEAALVQVTALDRRLDEDGGRVFDLAYDAAAEKQYDTAIEGFEYIVAKGQAYPLFTEARIELLNTRKKKVLETNDYTNDDIANLRNDYESFLDEMGKNAATIVTIRDLAQLHALYLNDLDTAIQLLDGVVDMPGAPAQIKAQCKLDLGDYYLMKNEVWEASLLYSQVDKAFKEDHLGELARFKNAKLSYYNGDFEWAQAQLDVLKASTSELISNDALELSVFITDNMGLDTTTVPMSMFARADLLILQNKIPAAVQTLDSISRIYPAHALDDDIIMTRAKIKIKQRDYEGAVPLLEDIVNRYGTDLLADNAKFMLADMYENRFDDKEKAMQYYQDIMVDYPGSLFVVEARKRFRQLRGDFLN